MVYYFLVVDNRRYYSHRFMLLVKFPNFQIRCEYPDKCLHLRLQTLQ